jgi:hypothetical protein
VPQTNCETVTFDMAKNKTLTEIELYKSITEKTVVTGIIWRWSDGTVTSSPSTLRATNTIKIPLETN